MRLRRDFALRLAENGVVVSSQRYWTMAKSRWGLLSSGVRRVPPNRRLRLTARVDYGMNSFSARRSLSCDSLGCTQDIDQRGIVMEERFFLMTGHDTSEANR